MRRVYSSREVGKMVGADPSSVNRWIDSGRLKAYRTPGGHRRVMPEDLSAFLGGLGIPLPDELRPAGRFSLLIQESDEANLKALRKGLLRLERELDLRACTSALDALIQIGIRRPDVLLLDAASGVDAAEICRRVKANPETRAVALIAAAARPTTALESKLREAGALGLLPKPVKPAVLLELARSGVALSAE
jgi:excisionase family DNA binding protein